MERRKGEKNGMKKGKGRGTRSKRKGEHNKSFTPQRITWNSLDN
jgi:hypothetical protein